MNESDVSITALDSIGSFGIGSGSLGSLSGEYPDMFGYGTMPPGAVYYNTPSGPSPAEQYYPIPYDAPPAQKYYAPHGSNSSGVPGTAAYFMGQVSASIEAFAASASANIHAIMTSSPARFAQRFSPISSAFAAPRRAPPRIPINENVDFGGGSGREWYPGAAESWIEDSELDYFNASGAGGYRQGIMDSTPDVRMGSQEHLRALDYMEHMATMNKNYDVEGYLFVPEVTFHNFGSASIAQNNAGVIGFRMLNMTTMEWDGLTSYFGNFSFPTD